MKRPLWLGIETSSPRLSLALADETRILCAYTGDLQWRHADRLFTGMQDLFRRARRSIDNVTGVAVCAGPGSFTGIRIGLAAARALGQAKNIAVVAVSGLEALAHAAPPGVRWICPRIDGLRDHVFTALFERTPKGLLRRRLAEQRVTEKDWAGHLRGTLGRQPVWFSNPRADYPTAAAILERARPRLANSSSDAWRKALPLYIRDAAAVERRREGRAP